MSVGGVTTSWKHGTLGAPTVLTNYTTDTMNVKPDFSADEVDATTYGAGGYRSYEQSFKDASIDVTYKYDDTLALALFSIYNATTSTEIDFELGPNGTTTGKLKVSGAMVMTKCNMDIGVGDLEKIEVTWRVSGAPDFDAYA